MLDDFLGSARKLDYPFEFSASGPGLSVFLAEEADAYLIVSNGYTSSGNDERGRPAASIVTVQKCVQAIFGYPNEEAYWMDPRSLGHGFYEIEGSAWRSRIELYNEKTFETQFTNPQFKTSLRLGEEIRHFFVGSKDRSAQFLARDLTVEVFEGWSYRDLRSEVLARMDG